MESQELLQQAIPELIAWYRENRREMPWRRDKDPYHVWLSETMLQQTRIETVIPYYESFLRELPTVADLAAVPEEKLLKMWEGLGYYSRARNLKKAAESVMTVYGGTFPKEAEALRRLPGIGAYTAGAISSIAFGQPEPAVDGNVLRVYMRLTACADDVLAEKTKARVTGELRTVYPTGADASDLTEGIMELGEVICIPNGVPLCAACPLGGLCRAALTRTTDQYPVRLSKKERRKEARTVFLLCCDGAYAVRRRAAKGLLAGMWEFPNTEGSLSLQEAEDWARSQMTEPIMCEPCGNAKHIFTHVEWQMTGYLVTCNKKASSYEWKTPDEILRDYAIPSAFRYFTKRISTQE